MDLVFILRELVRRRLAVALVVVLAVAAGAMLYSNAGKQVELGAARTQVIVDAPDPSLGDLRRDLTPLVARAAVYARYMASPEVVSAISKETGVPPGSIVASGPTVMPSEGNLPSQENRAGQVAGEPQKYRLQIQNEVDLPLVSIYAQAPTAAAAAKLADGAAKGLSQVVSQLQEKSGIPDRSKVQIRQLGPAQGSSVNPGAGKSVAVIGFLGVLLLGLIAILVISGLIRGWRRAAVVEDKAVVKDHGADLADERGDNGLAPARLAPEQDPIDDDDDDPVREVEQSWRLPARSNR